MTSAAVPLPNWGSDRSTSNRHQIYYPHYPPAPTDITISGAIDSSDETSLLQQPVNFWTNPSGPLSHSLWQTPGSGINHTNLSAARRNHHYMYQYQQNTMGGLTANLTAGVKRSRDHQRTPSSSTIASNGPASPYSQNTMFPRIANIEQSPGSPAQNTEQTVVSKMPTPSQTPTESGFGKRPKFSTAISNAHLAMKDFGIDHHNHQSDETSEDLAPSRQSTSTCGDDSPATPQSGSGDVDTRIQCMSSHDYRNPIQLHRTESQVYQDELYNPNFVYTSAPSTKPSSTYLSPHRNLVTERLENANSARTVSPSDSMQRERSPFRQESSSHAFLQDWKPAPGQVGTAADMRQRQKEEAEQAELARQRPKLQREPTETISPKDAMLEYSAGTEAPLFQDNIPNGYKHHFGGAEQWTSNVFSNQANSYVQGLPANNQQNMAFSNATTNQTFVPDFDFALLPPDNNVQSQQFPMNFQPSVTPTKKDVNDQTPDFPPALASMESSVSDLGPGPSSQESLTGRTSTPQRPDDTRANTGNYTCTYHGCTQRFDSPGNLQRHKREYHRSQQSQREGTSTSATESLSPRSSSSPAPSGTGMTSAALLARNSQAGPHKCTSINPSTGKPCNTIFSRPYDLTRHEDTIHNNRKQKVRCPLCREEKTFSRNDALTRHMRVVHPEVEAYGKRGRRGD